MCSTFCFVDVSDDFIKTRGSKYKLIQHHRCCYHSNKFNFTNRVIPIWNSSIMWCLLILLILLNIVLISTGLTKI